ncbi:acyltransferase family protein [Microbacterium sp. NPDC087665]|uniref:acyltransferase family protein n=1 Tax=Microbacterium sp. NPDC087665 TaxID=3364194 RepID=UPI0037FD1FA4
MTSLPPAVASERFEWADAARGLSVTLIVVMHLWAIHLTFWVADAAIMRVIADVVEWTTPLRIPLFFFVSGFLASRSLRKPWRDAWRGRVFGVVYLYVLWVGFSVAFLWIENYANGQPTGNPVVAFATNLIAPGTHLWYLWALIVMFLAVWATKAVPGWIVLAAAAAISVFAPFFLDHPYTQVGSAVVFYVVGARFPAITAWMTSPRRMWIFAGAAAVYTVSMLLGPTGPYGFSDPFTSAVGVVAMVAILAAVSNQRWTGALKVVGRNTLPIFILNPFVFILLNDLLVRNADLAAWLAASPRGAAVYTAAIIVATLAISIGIKVGADRIGMRWLFAMPQRWFRRPVAVALPATTR